MDVTIRYILSCTVLVGESDYFSLFPAPLFLWGNVLLLHRAMIQNRLIDSFKGCPVLGRPTKRTILVRRFFSAVFFVLCGSIFDKKFMGYSSVFPSISVPRETRSTDFER